MILPQQFIEKTKVLLQDEYKAFEKALLKTSPTSIQVNSKMDYQPSGELIP